jgi:hypothetical protein
MSAGGRQEAHRWRMQAAASKPSIRIIEPGEEEQRASTVPFGFARELQPKRPPVWDDETVWEGMGL